MVFTGYVSFRLKRYKIYFLSTENTAAKPLTYLIFKLTQVIIMDHLYLVLGNLRAIWCQIAL